MAGLRGGTTICLFDGSPGGRSGAADWSTLWRFAAATRASFFGAGAAFYASCMKAGVVPSQAADLSALRALGSTGSPLAAECYLWAYASLPKVFQRSDTTSTYKQTRPFPRERDCRCSADSGARSGDKDDLSLKSSHNFLYPKKRKAASRSLSFLV